MKPRAVPLPYAPAPIHLGKLAAAVIRSFRRSLCVTALAAALMLAAADVRAGLTFELHLYTYNDSYVFYTPLTTNATPPAAPLGTYTISSPQQPTNGSWRQFEMTTNGLS